MLYLSFIVVRPFITTILASAVIAYLFRPFYRSVNSVLKRRVLSAFFVSISIILVLIAILVVLVSSVANESRGLYLDIREKIALAGEVPACEEGYLCMLISHAKDWLANPTVRTYVDSITIRFRGFFIDEASAFFLHLPAATLNIFIAVFITFYLLMDGPVLVTKLGKLLPIKRGHQAELLSSFEEITSGVIKGQVIVALIQGALGALGFYFFGVKSPILWGVVMAIFAFIPIFGTAVVWFPAGTILVLTGLLSKNVLLVWKGMGLLVYGAVVVSSADNFLRPLVVGRKANVHPILVLLGVLGGLKAFGFIGFVIGPLILALLMTFIRIYQRQKNEIAG